MGEGGFLLPTGDSSTEPELTSVLTDLDEKFQITACMFSY